MDEENKKFTLNGKTYVEGDYISIDGSTGNIYDGIIPTVDAEITDPSGSVQNALSFYQPCNIPLQNNLFLYCIRFYPVM